MHMATIVNRLQASYRTGIKYAIDTISAAVPHAARLSLSPFGFVKSEGMASPSLPFGVSDGFQRLRPRDSRVETTRLSPLAAPSFHCSQSGNRSHSTAQHAPGHRQHATAKTEFAHRRPPPPPCLGACRCPCPAAPRRCTLTRHTGAGWAGTTTWGPSPPSLNNHGFRASLGPCGARS